jgi:cellulose biosynthesis protein BcsQ
MSCSRCIAGEQSLYFPPAYRSRFTDNALVATANLVLPLAPGNEAMAGLERTIERQISPLRQHMDVDVLALVPNMLSGRIDQQTQDLSCLNASIRTTTSRTASRTSHESRTGRPSTPAISSNS